MTEATKFTADTTPSGTVITGSFVRVVALTMWLLIISTQGVEVVFLSAAAIMAAFLVTGFPEFSRVALLLLPFFLLTTTGVVVGGASADFEAWPFLRDIALFAKAPLVLLAAFGLAKWVDDFDKILRAVFFASVILAGSYLAEYMMERAWLLDRRTLQLTVGRAYYLTAFGLLVAVVRPRAISQSFGIRFALCSVGSLVICLAAVVSTSRGIFLGPAFFVVCSLIYRTRVPFQPFLVGAILLVVFFSLPPLYSSVGGLVHILDNPSLQEVFASDFGSELQILTNFRSYEAYLSWQQFQEFSTLQQLIGKGFGSLVELSIAVELGVDAETASVLQAVPITHLSLLTALIKFGYPGAAIYMMILWQVSLRRDASPDRFVVLLNQTAVTLALFIVWTFQGFFSPLDLMNVALFIIGVTQAEAVRRTPTGT